MWYLEGNNLLNQINNTKTSDDEMAFWYIGQCGFVFKRDKVIYIDPVLNDIKNDNGESVRLYDAPFKPEDAKVDIVLCTHAHIDHLAPETIKGMYENNPGTTIVAPLECAEILSSLGVADNDIQIINPGATIDLDGIKVEAFLTEHPKRGEGGSVAYLIDYDGIKLLHLGDTYLTDELIDDLKGLDVDILFAPINGMDYMRAKNDMVGNLNVDEVAYLTNIIKPDLVIPMHYDMVKDNTENPLRLLEKLRSMNWNKKSMVPLLGERVIYKKG